MLTDTKRRAGRSATAELLSKIHMADLPLLWVSASQNVFSFGGLCSPESPPGAQSALDPRVPPPDSIICSQLRATRSLYVLSCRTFHFFSTPMVYAVTS